MAKKINNINIDKYKNNFKPNNNKNRQIYNQKRPKDFSNKKSKRNGKDKEKEKRKEKRKEKGKGENSYRDRNS